MVSEILARIEEAIGNPYHIDPYIFRGENECYDKVSSSLYRLYEKKGQQWEDLSKKQKDCVLKKPEKERNGEFLSERFQEVQHLGGKTDWIDFTYNPLVALFFACAHEDERKRNERDGRIIVAKESDFGETHRPSGQHINPLQYSVLVRPENGGVIDIADAQQIRVHKNKKGDLLNELGRLYGIQQELLFNDIHGYIRFQERPLLRILGRKTMQMPITRVFVHDDKGEKWKVASEEGLKTTGEPTYEGRPTGVPFWDGTVCITGSMLLTEEENDARAILCQAYKDSREVLIEEITKNESKYTSKEKSFLGHITDFSEHEIKFSFRLLRTVTWSF